MPVQSRVNLVSIRCPCAVSSLTLLLFVIITSHVLLLTFCCSDSAFIAHHVPLSHSVPYTSTGLILPWCWSLLPTRVLPITAVSQEAVDGAFKQTELLSLMFSLSSAAQITPYTVWDLLNYGWLTFEQYFFSVPETYSQTHEISHSQTCTMSTCITFILIFCFCFDVQVSLSRPL